MVLWMVTTRSWSNPLPFPTTMLWLQYAAALQSQKAAEHYHLNRCHHLKISKYPFGVSKCLYHHTKLLPSRNFAPLMSKETEKSSSDENQKDKKELHALLRELRLLHDIKQAALKDQRRELVEWEVSLRMRRQSWRGGKVRSKSSKKKSRQKTQRDPECA